MTDTKQPIMQYQENTGQTLQDLMPGILAFGIDKMNEYAKQAMDENTVIEFYYASDGDMSSDILSVKFTPRRTS